MTSLGCKGKNLLGADSGRGKALEVAFRGKNSVHLFFFHPQPLS